VNRDPRDYVENIDLAIRFIAEWVSEGRQRFDDDLRTRAALMRMMQELSESMRRLHPVLGDRYPEMPWREVIGFRNVLVHDYLGLNLDRIWHIATTYIPTLEPHIERMLAELSS